MKRGTNCNVHSHQAAVPIETHHIWPLEYSGKSLPANLIDVCSNGHGDTHYYLNLLLKHGGIVPMPIARHFGYRVQHLAKMGYLLIEDNAPHLLPALKKLAGVRLDDTATSSDHEQAWRDFHIAYRGCPFGRHEPGESHNMYCYMLED